MIFLEGGIIHMSKTKIIVLQMKELVYTGIFVGLGILLIVLLFVMFYPTPTYLIVACSHIPCDQ